MDPSIYCTQFFSFFLSQVKTGFKERKLPLYISLNTTRTLHDSSIYAYFASHTFNCFERECLSTHIKYSKYMGHTLFGIPYIMQCVYNIWYVFSRRLVSVSQVTPACEMCIKGFHASLSSGGGTQILYAASSI